MGEKKNIEKAKDGEKRKDRTMVITMAKLRMAHASTHGARKPPGPKRMFAINHLKLGYPELCHNRLDCFCFVLNLVGVEQN